MKYFTALVNATLSDGSHHFTPITFLIKRKRSTFAGELCWEYTIKDGYARDLDDMANKPIHIFTAGTYEDAIHIAFKKGLGRNERTKLELLREVVI